MSLGAILGTALLVTLTRPSTWVLALAGFLVRGGIVWFLIPVLVWPSPVGLANALGPSIVTFVFGGLTLGLILLMLGGAAMVVVWLVGGGLAAAAIEVELVRAVATDDEVATPAGEVVGAVVVVPDGRTLRVLAIRLVVLAPLLVVAIMGTTRIVAATYAELSLPTDTTTPITWRVLTAVPDVVVLVLVVWALTEIVGAWAVRRVVLRDPSIGRAVLGGIGFSVRHPLRSAVLYLVPWFALLLVLIPAAGAASLAWSALRSTLTNPSDPVPIVLALAIFVGLWTGGLVLAGAVCAWRQAVWTVAEVTRGRGTFGGSVTGRPGDWKPAGTSGTL